MKKFTKLSGILLVAIVMIQCHEDEEIKPRKQTETETLNVSGDSTQSESLSFVGEKSNESESGFDLKGGLYVETDTGKVAVMENAEFSVTQDAEGNMESVEGTGPVQLPDLEMFKSFDLESAKDALLRYNTGKYFKETNEDFKELPLRDTSNYFYFNILNLASGEEEDMSVKNAKLGVTSYFVNVPQKEIIIPTGSFGFDIPGKSSFSVGDDLAIGISGTKSFHFKPQQYEDSALNAFISEKEAFSEMTGFLYLSGDISLSDKLPVKIGGSSVLDADMDEVFTNGLGSGSVSFSYAINGKVTFGHDVLELLPRDFEVDLTNATYKLEHSATDSKQDGSFQFAGTFDDNVWMETLVDGIAGTNISQYVPFSGNEGSMYASFGDDWEFFVDTFFGFNTPHLGKQPTRRGTLHITEDQLAVTGGLAIPFVPGEVSASGEFGYDGDIHLEAKAGSGIEIEDFKLDGNLDFDIYNDKATLVGNLDIPYGLGTVDIDGTIDSEGMTFSGYAGNKDVDFNGVEVPIGEMDIYANLRKTNPELSIEGNLILEQLKEPIVNVSGTIDSRGIELSGKFDNQLRLHRSYVPLIDISITARTWQGVYFNGGTDLPFGLLNGHMNGHIKGNKSGIGGLPEIFLDVEYTSDPRIKFGRMSLPTSDLDLTVSTAHGIKFNGYIDLGSNLLKLPFSGNIEGDDMKFIANFDDYFWFGPRKLYSDLKFYLDSKKSSGIIAILGDIKTPFGSIDVSGAMKNYGDFVLIGDEYSRCKTFKNPVNTFSGKYYINFKFSPTYVNIDGNAYLCDNNCDEATNCSGVSLTINTDWENGGLSGCIPVPLLGDQCF